MFISSLYLLLQFFFFGGGGGEGGCTLAEWEEGGVGVMWVLCAVTGTEENLLVMSVVGGEGGGMKTSLD